MTDVAAESTPDPTPTSFAGFGSAERSTVDTVRERTGEAWGQAGDAVHEAADAVQDAAGKAYEVTREAAGNLATRIRNNATLPAARGRTTIANEVVEKIAGIAAREVPGVYDLGGDAARLISAVRERLRLGEESAAQGVSVKLEGKQAEITIVIVIEFGFQVFSVTEKVREKVISSVENLLGLDVTAVDVTVDDVHVEDEGPLGDDVQRAVGYSPETKAIVVGGPPQS
ncbi:MAG: hypothetical protein V7603_6533 [Micromonosporaceae bacterium]